MNMKHTHESGRSMIEMLGVLAIIGVLSVGGIQGRPSRVFIGRLLKIWLKIRNSNSRRKQKKRTAV